MLGDGSCRLLLYLLGYITPAYSCFKALEQNESTKVKEWCIYWLLLAVFTTIERLLLDWLIFWLPLYYEAKVLFILYLWHPRTQGALYLYGAYVQPFLVTHEPTVDQHIQEAKIWMSDFFTAYFQRFTQFVQSKAHVAVSALQNMQQAKIEKVQNSSVKPRRHSQGQQKSSTSLDDLPSPPTTKLD